MKNLFKMLSLCMCFVVCIFAVSCKHQEETDPNATKNYYAKLGYYEVVTESNVHFDFNKDKMVKINKSCVMVKPKTKLTLFAKLNNFTSLNDDVQHETINFETSTFLAGFDVNNEIVSFKTAAQGISITKNTKIKLAYSSFTIKGVAIYENAPNNQNYEEFISNKTYIQNQISIAENKIISTDNFLKYVYFNSSINNQNPETIDTNSTYKIIESTNDLLNISIEIFLETTNIYSYLILQDSNNNIYLYKHNNDLNPETSCSFTNLTSNVCSKSTIIIQTSFDLSTEPY